MKVLDTSESHMADSSLKNGILKNERKMKQLKPILLDDIYQIWCMSHYQRRSWGIPISPIKGATLNDFVTDFQGFIANSIVRSQPWQKNVQPHNRAKGLGLYEGKSSIGWWWKCKHFYTESATVLTLFLLFACFLPGSLSVRIIFLGNGSHRHRSDCKGGHLFLGTLHENCFLYKNVTLALLSFRCVNRSCFGKNMRSSSRHLILRHIWN